MVAPPTCTAMSAAKVNNYTDYTHGETFTITDSNGTVIGAVDNVGNITGLTVAGTYTLTITRGTCRAAAVDFDITDKLPAPAKPAITLTPASCTSPTVPKISNYTSGVTYVFTKADGTPVTGASVANGGVISGLAVGTYKVKAEKGGCTSDISDAFEIKAQKAATIIGANPQSAVYVKNTLAAPLTATATGQGTLTYKWYKNTTNSYTNGTEVGNNATYNPLTDTVGSLFYWAEITGDCGTKKTSIAEIKVVEIAPTIKANNDPEARVAKGGVVDVLSNDRVNGNPATPANVDVTIANDGGLTGVTADPATGKLKVPTNARPGTYDVEYRICVKGATSPCDTAKAKITVTPDATPNRAIKAVDDNFGKIPNTVDYTTTNTVFSTGVDTLEGVPGILSPETDVVLHKGAVTRQDGTAVQAGTITMNNNGSITVKKGTPIGTYTYTYKICEKAVPTNCSEEAKVTFEVVDNPILAKDDEFEIGTLGGLTLSVLNNDIFAGKIGPTTNEVIIEPTSTERNDDPKLKMRFIDGRIDVEKGIAPGIHKYYYTISDKNDKTKSSSAVVTIKVVTFAAGDDEHEVFNNNGTDQHIEKPSIFDNDEVDGKRPKPGVNVTFTSTPVKDKNGNVVPGIEINPQDGTITVKSGTPDGTYTYSYTICKKMTPPECKTAKGVLKLLPALKAVDDDFTATPVNPTKGAVNVGNVLENDEYAGGKALTNLDKLKAVITGNDGLVGAKIDEQGNLIIPQGAPVKVYELTYDLCIKDHPGACKSAKIKVEVIKDKPLTIYNGISVNGDGENDYFKIEGIEYYPKNNLKIFNRWGVLVYERDGYTNNEPFDGHSNGRATISADSKLPQGTYYYILEYEDSNDQSHTEKGWLYLKY